LRHIIIAAEGINDMDASGQESLALTIDRVRSAGIDISMAEVHLPVIEVLERTHLLDKLGRNHIYPSLQRAINAVHAQTHTDSGEPQCPLKSVCAIGESSPSAIGEVP
jgi:anti-anti-sigma regulatory factor